MKLHQLAHARTGDKGDTLTLSVFAYRAEDLPLLTSVVTAERVKAHLGDIVQGKVTRWELPNVGGLHFVCEHALLSGVTTSLALDPHGKSLSFAVLNLDVGD